MRNRALAAYPAKIVPHAEGRVLEIGIGSGPNLPFYADRADEAITRLIEDAGFKIDTLNPAYMRGQS